MTMALLDDVKLALRISPGTTAYDGEVQDLIAAAKADLKRAGVDPTKVDAADDALDPLIKRAIVVKCKAEFGFDNPDAERLSRAYEHLVTALTLSQDYLPPKGA